MKYGLLIGAVVVAALIMAIAGVYGYVDAERNAGIGMETQLNAQYLDNQNELSAYISSVYEQIGVAKLKSEKMNQILTDAVKGRYEGENGKMGYGKGTPFFSAIVEAYPNLDLTIFDKIATFVAAGREAYKNKQTKLLDQLRAYDRWRQEGLIHSQVVRVIGFPSDALEARVGTTVYRGKEAREKMYLIVLASDAKKAYETGTMEPLQIK